MSQEQILEILKGGDFTIAYHDNGVCSLYRGKHDYDELPEEEVMSFHGTSDGYIPQIVKLMCAALGGKCETI